MNAKLLQAVKLHQANQLKEAEELYRRVLIEESENADALHLLGLIELQKGTVESAATLIQRAIRAAPGQPGMHHNLGVAQLRLRDLPAAEASFRQALALNAQSPGSSGLLAQVLCERGRTAEAIDFYKQAIAQTPDNAALQRCLADALHASGRVDEAATAYRQALTLAPDDGDALWGLTCALTTLGEYAEAAEHLRRVVAAAPDWAEARHNLARALHELGETDAAIDAFRVAAERLAAPETSLGAIATIIPGAPSANNRSILEARRSLGARATEKPLDLTASRAGKKSPKRLRVGYVSSFFRDRNWMKQVWALINHHDRSKVQLHLFSDDPESTIGEEYQRSADDHFHDISRATNLEAAQAIAAQDLDVLVDLNGYSKLSRLPLFFHRPAPVIVAWYNMYATSGLSCFDYLIGDDTVIPPEEEAEYSERILRVPGGYLPLEIGYKVPDIVSPPCLERGFIAFGCLAPQYKITPPVIEAYAGILKQSPTSRLTFKNRFLRFPSHQQYLKQRFEKHGVSAERILTDGPAEHFDFLAKYGEIDLALDTFPYNGGTTTMECLWQGVPMLCFHGDRWASRISASILAHAGLAEYVAGSVNEFREMAVKLAKSPATPGHLAQLRATMRKRLLGSALCDVQGFARNMEEIYGRICKR